MIYTTLPVLAITSVIIFGVYLGVWGGVLDAFSNEKLRNDMVFASRMTEYEEARTSRFKLSEESPTLMLLKQSGKLSTRQREVFKDVLDETNRKLLPKFLVLLVLIAWGSIFISHKIAGPFYRFQITLDDMAKGNFRPRLHLRKGDMGQKTVGVGFNAALKFLDNTFAKLKNIIRSQENDPAQMTRELKEELSKIKTSEDA